MSDEVKVLLLTQRAPRTVNVLNPGRMNREQFRQWMAAMKRGAHRAAFMAKWHQVVLSTFRP